MESNKSIFCGYPHNNKIMTGDPEFIAETEETTKIPSHPSMTQDNELKFRKKTNPTTTAQPETVHDSELLTKIINEIDDCVKNEKYQELNLFLDENETLAEIQSLKTCEKLSLTQKLYKKNITTAYQSFNTKAGRYLAAQPTSDQAQHNAISHPNSLVTRLGLNNENTKYIYSERLIGLMNEANYTNKEKENLLPPVLFQGLGHIGISFPDLSESALLFPEAFLSEELCQYIHKLQEKYCEEHIRLISLKIDSPEMLEKVEKCHKAMQNFSRQVPVLAQLGAQLKVLLKEKNILIPENSVNERYLVEHFATNVSSITGIRTCTCDQELFSHLITQQRKIHPYLAGLKKGCDYFFTRNDTKNLLRKAMNILSVKCESDVRPGSAPVFVGFVREPFASWFAKPNGFLDSNWSGNLVHGKYSHPIQLTILNLKADLKQKTLETIIDKHLWSYILDLNPYTMHITEFNYNDPSLPFLMLNSVPVVYSSYHSPIKYHELLTTGKLSAALEEIQQVINLHPEKEKANLLRKFAYSMGIKPKKLTMERLTEIISEIRVLEMVVSTKHLNSIERMKEEFPEFFHTQGDNVLYKPESLYLDANGIGNFSFEKNKMQVKKSETYRRKGYGVVLGCKKSITENKTFVAFPPAIDAALQQH